MICGVPFFKGRGKFMSEKYKIFYDELNQRKVRLKEIKNQLKESPALLKLFNEKNWFDKVESQINIWEKNPDLYIKGRQIIIPEYELFRYLAENAILKNFIKTFSFIEDNIDVSNTNQLNQWNSTKSQLFANNVEQIYSSLFEMLVLGKLISTSLKIDIYYENIEGRILIDSRYIYFEAKSLQRSQHDLEGFGAASTVFDKNQIYRALKDKNRQLYRYRTAPTIIFLSLYRLADPVTAEWYINEYFAEDESELNVNNRILSGVKLYEWFTAQGKGVFYINPNAINNLTEKELAFFNSL
jgi:hypothetical protein